MSNTHLGVLDNEVFEGEAVRNNILLVHHCEEFRGRELMLVVIIDAEQSVVVGDVQRYTCK